MTPEMTAAAMHGIATNEALTLGDRLGAALQALAWYEAEVQRLSENGEEEPEPLHVPPHLLDIAALVDDEFDPTEATQFGVQDPDTGRTHVYGDQSWVAYGTCIEDGTHPNGKIRYRTIGITYGEWQDA